MSFESVHALLKVLTPRRYALMEAVKAQGAFDSIEQLALAVARDRASVSRDVKALASAGLLRAKSATLRGNGRRTAIAPVARRLVVRFTL